MRKFIVTVAIVVTSFFSMGEDAAEPISKDMIRHKNKRLDAIDEEINKLLVEMETLDNIRNRISEADSIEDVAGSKKRPKIGLALSGCGSKGAAHVGVLKVLEENNVPIDYIAGTSIGSIVAALYAAGYTTDQLEDIILTLEWDALFKGVSARELKSIEQKLEAEKYFLSLEIDEDYNLQFPKGVLKGESMYLELKRLLWPVQGIHDFDNLPIPYRAITTDLQTGKAVTISEGDVALAAFKSMAIPTIIDPVNVGGSFYVDGGLARNLPVTDVINMGADIVIAVDIAAHSVEITETSNIVQVINRMSTYQGDQNTEQQKKLADVLIVPDVKNHNTVDFTNLEGLILEGEVATRKVEYALSYLSFPDDFIKREPLDTSKRVTINNIKIKNDATLSTKTVYFLKPHGDEKTGELSRDDLSLWISRINALNYVDRVFYEIEDDTLILDASENNSSQLNAGLNYNSDIGAKLGILGSFASIGETTKNTVVSIEAAEYPAITFKRYATYSFRNIKLIGLGKLGVNYSPLHAYDEDDRLSEIKTRKIFAGLSLGTAIREKVIFGVSLEYRDVKATYEKGDRSYNELLSHEDYFRPSLFLLSDTRDKPHFATKGVYGILSYFNGESPSGSDVDFRGSVYMIDGYIPVTDKLSLILSSNGGKLSGDSVPAYEHFKLGGLRNDHEEGYFAFYGMNTMREYTYEFLMAAGTIQYRVKEKLYLVARYNVVTFTSDILETRGKNELGDDYDYGYGGGIAWDTIIGPMEFMITNDVDSSDILINAFLGYDF